jgi:hypothetical protein
MFIFQSYSYIWTILQKNLEIQIYINLLVKNVIYCMYVSKLCTAKWKRF